MLGIPGEKSNQIGQDRSPYVFLEGKKHSNAVESLNNRQAKQSHKLGYSLVRVLFLIFTPYFLSCWLIVVL